MKAPQQRYQVLSIDIGGTHIKATILDQNGDIIEAYRSAKTPLPATPKAVLATITDLVKDFTDYAYVSVGFPGYVRDGVIQTAPNLGTQQWRQVRLEDLLHEKLGKPVRVINDADMQGLGIVNGKGFEILITLGTGFGTAFLKNGILFPHIELAHHPIIKDTDYDQYIGDKVLKKIGVEKWNERLKEVVHILRRVFNYDRLYIGGGNARHIDFELDDNIAVVSNEDGIKGGARLWAVENYSALKTSKG